MNKITAWLKKMNVKVTWKSLVGLAFALTGIISAAVGTGVLPKPVNAALIAVGGALVAFERIADAIDNRTSVQYQMHTEVLTRSVAPKK